MASTNPLDFALSEADGWVAFARCGEEGAPNMFPHEKDADGLEAARAACGRCVVRDACLAAAMTNGEQHGVWGGLTAGERTDLRRRTRRAEDRLRRQIQDQVSVNPGTAKVIRGRRVDNVIVVGGAV